MNMSGAVVSRASLQTSWFKQTLWSRVLSTTTTTRHASVDPYTPITVGRTQVSLIPPLWVCDFHVPGHGYLDSLTWTSWCLDPWLVLWPVFTLWRGPCEMAILEALQKQCLSSRLIGRVSSMNPTLKWPSRLPECSLARLKPPCTVCLRLTLRLCTRGRWGCRFGPIHLSLF